MITKRIMALLLFVATVASVIVVNASAFTEENSEVSTDGFITIDENTDLAALGLEGAVVFEKDSDEASEDNSAQTDSVDKGEQSADNVTAVPNVMASDPVVYDFDKAEEPDLDESAVIEDGDEAPTEEVAESSSEVLIEDVAHESAEESNEVSSDVSAEPTPVTPNTSKTPTSVTPQSVIDREYETKEEYELRGGVNYCTKGTTANPNLHKIIGGNIAQNTYTAVYLENFITISGTVTVYGTLEIVITTGNWTYTNPRLTGFRRASGFYGPFFVVKNGGTLNICGVSNNDDAPNHENNYMFLDGRAKMFPDDKGNPQDYDTASDSVIVMESGSTCLLQGVQILDNHVTSDTSIKNDTAPLAGKGGAIRMEGGTLNLKDFEVQHCLAEKGGAIYATGNSVINYTSYAGVIVGKSVDSWIGMCEATYGGAIYLEGSATMTLNNQYLTIGSSDIVNYGEYINCAQDGGAVYLNGGTLNVTRTADVGFSYNRASNNGGAVYVKSGTLNVTYTFFKNNSALNGGGIYAEGGTVDIKGSSQANYSKACINNNTATNNGGGLFVAGGTVNLSNCSVNGNNAVNGGGVYTNGGTVNYRRCIMESNSATENGGGIYTTTGSKLNFGTYSTNTTWSSNISKCTAKNGGGVYVANGATVTANNGTFVLGTSAEANRDNGNTASVNGGGMYINGGTVSITSISKVGYNSAVKGGGIYVESGTLTVSGGTVEGNVASEKGGALYVKSGDVSLKAGGLQKNYAAVVTNTQVLDNIAPKAHYKGTGEVNTSGYEDLKAWTSYHDGKLNDGVYPDKTSNTYSGNGPHDIVEFWIKNFQTGDLYVWFDFGKPVSVQSVTAYMKARTTENDYRGFPSNFQVYVGDNGTTATSNPSLGTYKTVNDGYIKKYTVSSDTTLSGQYVVLVFTVPTYEKPVLSCGEVEIMGYTDGTGYDSSTPDLLGGGAYVEGGTFKVEGGEISGNQAGKGGGIYQENGTVTVSSGKVGVSGSPNKAIDGGGIFLQNGTLTLSGGNVQYNSAAHDAFVASGGGIAMYGGILDLNGGNINNNTADNNGGGIAVYGGTVNVQSGKINNNTYRNSDYYGGGIYMEGESTVLNITGGRIESNTALKSGGGIAAFNGTLNFSGGTVYKNTCTESGAGIFLSALASEGNTENTEDSGVRFTMSGSAQIDDNTNSGGNGGGIWVGAINSFTVTGGTISNNDTTASDSSGGGIFINRMVKNPIVISGVTINNNTTVNRGGGIYIGVDDETEKTLTVNISNCTVSSNTADKGGGIFINQGTHEIQVTLASGSSVRSNTATNGGGVYVYMGKFIMTGGSIESNINSTNGAGVYVDMSAAEFVFSGGSVKSNKASNYGGALYIKSGVATMSGDALMDSNTAVSGGAVYVDSTAIFNLRGGTISQNSTTSSNGAGVFSKGEFYMSNGAISENTSVSSGGGVCIDGGRFEFSGGSISENVCSGSGAGIYLRDGGASTFTMSNPEEDGEQVETLISENENKTGNGGGIWVGGITSFTMTGGTISGNILAQTGTKSGGGIFFNRMLPNPAVISGGTISGNNATWGGGIYVGDGTTAGVAGTLVVNISGNTEIVGNFSRYSTTDSASISLFGGAGIGVNGAGEDNANVTKYYGVEVNISGNVKIDKNEIKDSTYPKYVGGGGILVCGRWATVNFSGGSISENKAHRPGGGVCIRGGATFTMSGGTIAGNTATSYGGGIIVGVYEYEPVGGIFNMTGGTVSGNSAPSGGGGLFADDGATVYISGDANDENKPKFSGNSTNNDGAGIYLDGNFKNNKDGASATISNTVFENNVAGRYGGGIFVSWDTSKNYGKLDFSGCTFDECESLYKDYGTSTNPNLGGGGVCIDDGIVISELDLSSSLFVDCYAYLYGGGLSIKCGSYNSITTITTLKLDNSSFDGCVAEGDVETASNGGGLFLSGEIDTISYVCDADKECCVKNCKADAGSAILFGEKGTSETSIGEFNITNVTFEGNSNPDTSSEGVHGSAYGGTVKTEGETAVTLNVTDCIFRNNYNDSPYTSAHGGVFYWNSGQKTTQKNELAKLTITNCKFLGNRATCHGGAIYNEAVMEIINSEFAGNRAGDRGGAISVQNYGMSGQTPPEKLQLTLGAGTSLHHNYSKGDGGAISIFGNKTNVTSSLNNVYFGLEIDGAEIYDNVAKNNGGAISFYTVNGCDDYLDYSKAITINDGSLCGNKAGYTATQSQNGLFYADETESFHGKGGAIYMTTADNKALQVTVSGGTIGSKARSADSGGNYAYYGGGICVESKNITVSFEGGTILTNDAHYGGALYADAAQVNITEGANIFQNTACNGGGIAAVNGASIKMTGGYLCYNSAMGMPENGINTSYQKHGDLVGVGGGIYLADGVSASDRTTFELAPIDTSADVDSYGIYGNVADFSADDIFANAIYTKFTVPRALNMSFDAFEGNNRLRAVGWFEDYNIGDASYTSGLNGLGASNGDSVVRYRGNPQPVIAFVDSGDAQRAGISRTNYINTADTYVCLTLATAKLNSGKLTIIKDGQGIDPEQIFVYNVNGITEEGNQVSFSVQIRGTGNVMIDNLPDGTYTVSELKSWSWRYEVTGIVYNESAVPVTEDFVCSFVISFNNATPTIVFTNAKVKDKWVNHISPVHKNVASTAIYLGEWGNASYNNNNSKKFVTPNSVSDTAISVNSSTDAVFDFNINCVDAQEFLYFPIKGLTVGETYRISFKERYDGVSGSTDNFTNLDLYTYGCSVFVDFPTSNNYNDDFWESTGAEPKLWSTTQTGEQTGYVEFVADRTVMYWVWNMSGILDDPAFNITFTVTGFEQI